MAALRISISGNLTQLAFRVTRALPHATAEIVRRFAVEIWHSLVGETPVLTGAAARAWDLVRLSEFAWRVMNPKRYLLIVLSGRGVVVPVRARALHFYIEGREIFCMRSKAVKPNPFVQRAMRNAKAQFPYIAKEVLKQEAIKPGG